LLTEDLFRALRYTAGPPVSSDDLTVLADVPSVARKVLLEEEGGIEKVLEVVLQAFDRGRFPWLSERPPREASDAERERAIFASAAILASAQMSTERRHQEGTKSDAIAAGLLGLGLVEAKRRTIRDWGDIPAVGTFYRKARSDGTVDGREMKSRVDFVIRTEVSSADVLLCRVSNSALNSRKRLLKEALPIARDWQAMLGAVRTRTAIVLGGVYDPDTLARAQSDDLKLFWFHRIPELLHYLSDRTLKSE
jgi:hypothetical protein